jgi:hypothetical protein
LPEQPSRYVQLLFIGRGANRLAEELEERGFTTSALTATKWSEDGFGDITPQAVFAGTSPTVLERYEGAPSTLEDICSACDTNDPPIPVFIIPHKGPMVLHNIQQLGISIRPLGKMLHFTARRSPHEIQEQLQHELNMAPANAPTKK